MPNSDKAALKALSSQLVQVAQSQDWSRLAQLDALLSQILSEGHLSDLEKLEPHWHAVAMAHAQAFELCKQAKAEAATNLQNLDNAREAQHAYAWQEVIG